MMSEQRGDQRGDGWLVKSLGMLLLFASVAGCGGEQLPTYRYRLTVEVDTPAGLKTGSSVIEVESSYSEKGAWGPETSGYRATYRGEAVAVDIAPGQTLFALLMGQNGNSASPTAFALQLQPLMKTQPDWMEKTKQLVQIKGKAELSRNRSYPMLAYFEDIGDPSTIQKVDPDNLSAVFGDGFRLNRITVQITDSPVTAGIKNRFPWWDQFEQKRYDGKSGSMGVHHTRFAAEASNGIFSVGIDYER